MNQVLVRVPLARESVRQHYIETGENWGSHAYVWLSPEALTPGARKLLYDRAPLQRHLERYGVVVEHQASSPGEAEERAPDLLEEVLSRLVTAAEADALALQQILDPVQMAMVLEGLQGGREVVAHLRDYDADYIYRGIVEDCLPRSLRDEMEAAIDARLRQERANREDAMWRAAEVLKKQAQENEARLRDWATGHGSELLRARIEEGFDWEGLAQTEFSAWVLGTSRDTTQASWRKVADEERVRFHARPTLGEIEALRGARAQYDGRPVSLSLVWVTREEDPDGADADSGDTPSTIQRGRCMLSADVTTPDGLVVTWLRSL
jgi:hypothetical protein